MGTAFVRRWRVDSPEKFARVIGALGTFKFDFERRPMELILREELRHKSDAQRRLWHATMSDLAPHLGLTPAETKGLIKRLFFGVTLKTVTLAGREVPVEIVPSSEEADAEQYSELINFTLQFSAEQGIALQDRRTR